MPSQASDKYCDTTNRAISLRKTATDNRLRPMSEVQIQIYYHAALAAYVAGWDAYINNLVREFFTVTSNPLSPEFHAVHSLAKEAAERALKRFNTPNWENTRNLLFQQTGYDPINDWIWNRRRMGCSAGSGKT